MEKTDQKQKYVASVYFKKIGTYGECREHFLCSTVYKLKPGEKPETTGGTSTDLTKETIEQGVERMVRAIPESKFWSMKLEDVVFKYEYLETPGFEYLDWAPTEKTVQSLSEIKKAGITFDKKMPEYLKGLLEKYGARTE